MMIVWCDTSIGGVLVVSGAPTGTKEAAVVFSQMMEAMAWLDIGGGIQKKKRGRWGLGYMMEMDFTVSKGIALILCYGFRNRGLNLDGYQPLFYIDNK